MKMKIRLTIYYSGKIEDIKLFENSQLAYDYLNCIGFWGNPERTYAIERI